MAAGEEAAAQEPGGPRGPVDVSWLILQRLSDIKEQVGDLRRSQDDLRAEVKEQVGDLRRGQEDLRAEVKEQVEGLRAEVKADMKALDAKIEAVRTGLGAEIAALRNWSLGLLLLAILGLLAKLLIPGV